MNWKPIPSTGGKYLASDTGLIRHWKHSEAMRVTVLRGGAHVTVTLERSHQVGRSVARLVWEAFRGQPPCDCFVVCCNGDPHDTRLDNLELRRRGNVGRLSDSDVLAIFRRAANGETFSAIARSLGLSEGLIVALLHRDVYRHVPVPAALVERVAEAFRLPKLDRSDAQAIRQRAAAGERQAALARYYGVSEAMISRIVSGERWKP